MQGHTGYGYRNGVDAHEEFDSDITTRNRVDDEANAAAKQAILNTKGITRDQLQEVFDASSRYNNDEKVAAAAFQRAIDQEGVVPDSEHSRYHDYAVSQQQSAVDELQNAKTKLQRRVNNDADVAEKYNDALITAKEMKRKMEVQSKSSKKKPKKESQERKEPEPGEEPDKELNPILGALGDIGSLTNTRNREAYAKDVQRMLNDRQKNILAGLKMGEL